MAVKGGVAAADGANGAAENEEEKGAGGFRELGVCEELCDVVASLGFQKPTKIQAESLPHSLSGKDVIGLAETGSGKTAAFALPVLQKLLDFTSGARAGKVATPFAVVIAPTRELVLQIQQQFDAIGSSLGARCVAVTGGIDMMSQSIALAKRPHIVVASPGRLVDHMENTRGFSLKGVQFLVLDEADRLLNLDFERELNKVLAVLPRERQTLLFSATMTSKVHKLQRASLRSPVKVEVSSKYTTVDTLVQHYVFIPAKYKEVYLVFFCNEFAGNAIMVFADTQTCAQRLTYVLRNLGFGAVCIHGGMPQPKRLAALNKFRAKDRAILVATDVASRGLDIPSVDLVVNFDIPTNGKDYVHRVGRTARAGRSGRAINLVSQYDVENYQRVEALIEKKLDAYPCEEEHVLMLLERVNEAQRIAANQLRDVPVRGGKRSRRDADVVEGGSFDVDDMDEDADHNTERAALGHATKFTPGKKSGRRR